MPYITPDERAALDQQIGDLSEQVFTEGQLNYVISRLVRDFARLKGSNYAAFNAAIGVLECAKLELYRRPIASYEESKIVQNGDIE